MVIKPQKKRTKVDGNKKRSTKVKPSQLRKQQQDIYFYYHLKCNWIKYSNQRHKLTECAQKQDLYICCPQGIHFKPSDTYRLKVRGWKKIHHENGNQMKARVATFIRKIYFKIKTIQETMEGTT